ncbi:MAG TPA: VacJ family lipoprotein [Stellaceae bacterium]|nr:VacJ family lipoprotein [Stellaceae bacterium]
MALSVAIGGCLWAVPGHAQAPAAAPPAAGPADAGNGDDPFESTNRSIFDFNNQVDKIVLVPVANTYRAVLPEPVRDSVHDFLRNLDAPIVFANDVLQARPDLAGTTAARFVVNSTVGVGGLFDVATKLNLPYHGNDLGVTFAVWGIGDGPYLMLPVLGPSNVRDAIGQAGDAYGDPGNMVASNNGYMWATFARAGTQGVDERSRNIETLADIERTSLDYYATIRSLYRQRRAAEIRHEQPNTPNVSPMGASGAPTSPISYQVAPPPPEAPKQ